MMICDRRTFLVLTGSVAFAGSAFAKHNHHDGAKLLGGRLGTDGKHEIHKFGEHTVHVHVQNKKVLRVTATHRTKGEVPVKKYNTSKKMVQGDGYIHVAADVDGHMVQPVDFRVAQTIVSVGYSVVDPVTGDEEIYWYPAEMVVDPVTGAVDYIPVT
jgi:predicted DNA-binding WGR domain protein